MSMARHCSVEIAAVIVFDHGLHAGTCRARSLRTFAGGLLPVHPGTDQGYAVGHMHLDHAGISTSAGLSRLQCALIRPKRCRVLDMAVFGRDAPVVTRPAWVMAKRWVATPIYCRRAKASLSVRSPPPAAPPWPPDSRPTSLVGGGCQTMRHLDDVRSADTGRTQSQTQECRRPLDCRTRKGIGPAACLLSYGTWAAAEPRSRSSSCLLYTQSAIEACTH
jgi:hypothetical protein